MSIEFEQLRERARPWLDPIPGSLPTGSSARLEPEYQRVAAEVAKLDMPSGGAVDWKKVAVASGELLQTRTKDLVLGAYLAHALHVTGGIESLTTGVTFLAEMLDRFWDELHPDAKRLRGRANALQWFLEHTEQLIPDAAPPATGLPNVEALETAMKRLAQLVRQRFADSAPAFSPVLERIDRLRLSLMTAPAVESIPAPVPEAGTTAVPGPSPMAAGPSAPATAELASAADATDFLRGVGTSLIAAAGVLRRADLTDPASYRILRVGLWLHLSSYPPVFGQTTRVPPLPKSLRNQLAILAQNQKWAALLEETESNLSDHRFALDLHRYSWQALAGLGSTHDRAREAVSAEVRSLLARMPQLPGLAFSDGTLFADAQTKAWLDSESQVRDERPHRDASPAAIADGARLAQARKLLGAVQFAEALALLQQGVDVARRGRERFLARLDLARLAAGAGLTAVAKATFDDLGREAATHDLDSWEPQLVAECLKGVIAASRALPRDLRASAADLTDAYRRLCRLDPAAANDVWPVMENLEPGGAK